MEKENMNENKITSEAEETETLDLQTNEVTDNSKEQEQEQEELETNTGNDDIQELINGESNPKESSTPNIFANTLDQVLIVAGSAILLYLCDLVLKLFGYMFVRDNGSLVLAGGIIYFIINCVYAPIMRRSKLKGTLATRILNVN